MLFYSQSWKVEGGLRRFHAIDTRLEVLVTSPENAIVMRLGNVEVPPMVLSNEMMNPTGF